MVIIWEVFLVVQSRCSILPMVEDVTLRPAHLRYRRTGKPYVRHGEGSRIAPS